ncbi:4-hydroxythreonine-4-phosphate dehydrogenase [Alsobacter metallidurans]|uniref:4-hydroxythreonine-4-phosphate dehydrogenase n=2 Tax=Alsobacter metallidurans TaxID=340221 RepID=A0A917I558_9HYPH|nr:4-hydroxythreonine-4-phosphate dehydrogenase [Alsobacter metallidurans]
MSASATQRPVIAFAMGDPAGVSPELAAKLLALDEIRAEADLIVFGDRRILDEGARVAGVNPAIETIAEADLDGVKPGRSVFVDLKTLALEDVTPQTATLAGGQFATNNFRKALQLAAFGRADAVFFTPFNKKAMRLAYAGYDDEIRFINDVLGRSGPASEFNVLGDLWNARVTSHIPLSGVAAAITAEAIQRSLTLTDRSMRDAGFARPRIAVAGLNPHAGDGGNFGREEIDVIEPAVQAAAARGIACEGPFPSDTVFLRAKAGAFDAVLTMYHDQGQIAMKLMGFDRGVTTLGGLPFPVCTPAHGTAYDIAGQGVANIGASREAILLAARMGREARVRAAA